MVHPHQRQSDRTSRGVRSRGWSQGSCVGADVVTSASELASRHNATSSERPRVLLLSSSPFTDRMLRYSGMLDDLAAVCDIELWAMSARTERGSAIWRDAPAEVHPFPDVEAFRHFPFGYMRRL